METVVKNDSQVALNHNEYTDRRIDLFFELVKNDESLREDNKVLVFEGHGARVNGFSEFTHPDAGFTIPITLRKIDIRAEFADFLNRTVSEEQGILPGNLDEHVVKFIDHMQGLREHGTSTDRAYSHIANDEIKDILFSIASHYEEAFAPAPALEQVLAVPVALPGFDKPLRGLEEAFEQLASFNQSQVGHEVLSDCTNDRERVVAFFAYRQGKGIEDNRETRKELIESFS